MRKFSSKFRVGKLAFLKAFVFVILSNTAYSQLTPGGHLDAVFDNTGTMYSLWDISIDNAVAHGTTTATGGSTGSGPYSSSSCSSGYFTMWFEPGCGMDGSVSPEPERRAVLCQVLNDISNLIQSPCSTGTQKINIWVRASITDGLGVATPFYNFPFSNTVSGIADNAIWITLNSGKDAFTNVANPLTTSGGGSTGTTFFHGSIKFNFSSAVTWHTNLGTTPPTGTTDLYTVALHEMLHAMGFASLIQFDGSTVFGTGYNYFSRYDKFLQRSGTSLIEQPIGYTTGGNMYQYTFNTSLTPFSILSPGGTTSTCPSGYQTSTFTNSTTCTSAIKYNNGIFAQEVYTPSCFEKGSSLSHFEDECWVPSGFVMGAAGPTTNDQYFLMSNSAPLGSYNAATNPGVMKRYPTPRERQVLCDIGYKVNASFGNSSNLNAITYAGGVCGESVAGINDGITPVMGTFLFHTTSTTPVCINGPLAPGGMSILDNDYSSSGGSGLTGGSFKCLEVVWGTGTVSADHGTSTTNVYFTPAFGTFGVQLLRYIPIDASGVEGNITYVYIDVEDGLCISTACDLVANGNLENVLAGSYGVNIPGVHCWRVFAGTPDLFATDAPPFPYGIPFSFYATSVVLDVHPFSLTTNDHFINTVSYRISGVTSAEAIQETLSSSITPSNSYVISFWIASPFMTIPTTLEFAVTTATGLAPISAYMSALPSFLTPICDFNINISDNNWHYYTQTVTYTGTVACNTLVVIPAPWFNIADPSDNRLYIDDISIIPAAAACSFSLPASMCVGGSTFNLNTAVSPISGGTFSWNTTPVTGGVPTVSHSATFDPTAAYNAAMATGSTDIVTVCYTYTDPLGCVRQVCDETRILTTTSPITGLAITCPGLTTTLSDALPGGTWSSSSTAVATADLSTGIITGVTTGTTTITYTTCAGSVYQTLTVTTLPATITGSTSACPGTTVTLSDATSGGSWSSGNTLIATCGSSSGIVTGITAGTAVVSYLLASTGCYVTKSVTINPLPGTIGGTGTVCLGMTSSLSDATSGGTWSSGSTAIATINSTTGVYTGVAAGTSLVTYTLSTGCSSATTVTVLTTPTAITGTMFLCGIGATTSLSNGVSGGTWSSSMTSVADVGSSTGVLTSVATGSATITYRLSTGCAATTVVAVGIPPAAITGPSMTCTGNTITLSDVTTGGTWSSSGAATVGSSTGIVTGTAGGTATITYTTPPGCEATTTVNVYNGAGGACVPCTVFSGSFSVLGAGGTISVPILAGNYYIDNDVTIIGTVTCTDAVILIAPGVHLYVEPTASLELYGSHLFCCGSMWSGIVLQSDATQTGTVKLMYDASLNTTLIEDAKTGVSVPAPVTPTGGATNFVTCIATIFNRNDTGISIMNYSPVSPLAYEFSIQDAVFTSRDFSDYVYGSTYPFVWPAMYGAYGLKEYWDPSTTDPTWGAYRAPYNIDNPTAGGTTVAYSPIACHNCTGMQRTVGISLSSIGKGTLTVSSAATAIIGAPATTAPLSANNTEENLFDNINFGIRAENANVMVHNCTFINIPFNAAVPATPAADQGGNGIYAVVTDRNHYQLTIEPTTYTTPPCSLCFIYTTNSTNSFYNCRYGVYASDYYRLTGNNAKMITTQNNYLDGSRYGYLLKSSRYDNVNVNYNTITNVANGVSFTATHGPLSMGVDSQFAGSLSISYNKIWARRSPLETLNSYCHHAIVAQNTINSSAIGTTLMAYHGTVNTDYNNIYDARYSILVNNFWIQGARSAYNDVTAFKTYAAPNYGINYTGCRNSVVWYNIVRNALRDAMTTYTDDAYHVEASNSVHLSCNQSIGTTFGFTFYHSNPGTFWNNNNMAGHTGALHVRAGIIGPQGSPTFTNDNIWEPTNPSSSDTYVDSVPKALYSQLYVSSATGMVPTSHIGYPTTSRYLSTDIIPTTGPGSGCFLTYPSPATKYNAAYYGIVSKTVYYGSYASRKAWIAQYAVWRGVNSDTALTDTALTVNAAALQSFKTLAASSRYAYISGIEDALFAGDTATARAQLAITPTPLCGHGVDTDAVTGVRIADNCLGGDDVVADYKAFYNLYLNHMTTGMTGTDSLTLRDIASLCPILHGGVVYEARALYTAVFDEIGHWNDDSCAADTGYMARYSFPSITEHVDKKQEQRYSLQPNPSDGNITLRQQITDERPVNARVWNAVGMNIYKGSLHFKNDIDKLHISNVASGTYVLQLRDADGKEFILKFVINK